MNIAVFGSAFNPPTRGHKDAIEYVLEHTKVDMVLLVPSFKHAFAKDMVDYETRLHMLKLFVEDIKSPRVKDLALEHQIHSDSDQPVYTYDLLSFMQRKLYPDAHLSFVIGPDNKANWHRFYKADEIEQTWSLIIVPERIDVRSTMVRERLAAGADINTLVTPRVGAFLSASELYAD
jgi:nicotinate-nucleotide adenylyltransferase